MLRLFSCSVLFLILLMASGLALADTYKCTRPDGSVFFTDDPSQVPKGCVIERVKDLPPAGILPGTPAGPQPAPGPARPVAPQTQTGGATTFDAFKNRATLLVEQYQSARQRVFRSSFVADKQQARRELAEAKTQKLDLLSAVKQSALTSSQKREIEGLLSPITE